MALLKNMSQKDIGMIWKAVEKLVQELAKKVVPIMSPIIFMNMAPVLAMVRKKALSPVPNQTQALILDPMILSSKLKQ
mgnify:CR=1 FL=1